MAFVAIQSSDRFGRRWKQRARRPGILDTSNVTGLSDGAKWIWEEQQNHLRGAEAVLHVFHTIEHIAEASRCVFGAATEAASQWLHEGRRILIRDGWRGNSEFIGATRRRFRSRPKRKSLNALHNYLSSHYDH